MPPPSLFSRRAALAIVVVLLGAAQFWMQRGEERLVRPARLPARTNSVARESQVAGVPAAALHPAAPATQPAPERHRSKFDAFDEWLLAHRRREHPLPEHGVQLARERRVALKELIAVDPRAALAHAVPRSVRRELPATILAELETPVDAVGRLEVRAVCHDVQTEIRRFLTIGERRYEAHTFGLRLATLSKRAMPVHGIAVDGVLALDENPYRRIEPDELGPETAPLPAVVVAIGGEIRAFSSEQSLAEWRAEIAAAERAPDPEALLSATDVAAAPPNWTFGEKRVLWLRVEFADEPGMVVVTDATINASMATVNQYFQDISHGRCSLRTTILPGTLRLSQPKAYYNSEGGRSGELETETLRLARDYDAANGGTGTYHPDRVDRWIIGFRRISAFSWGGIAYIGDKGMLLNESWGPGIIAHELGHNHGLRHAHAWRPTGNSPVAAGEHVEYGDAFDVMGSSDSIPAGHFNARQKETLLYVESPQVTTVATSGTYRVHRHDHRDASGVQGLRIAAGRYEYFVEHRRLVPSSASAYVSRLQSGFLLHWTKYPDTMNGPGTYLLDATPLSSGGMADAPFALNQTFTDANRGISLTTVAAGGSEPNQWIDVRVDFGATGSNRNPAIAAAAPTPIVPARSDVRLTAVASDPDGDPLTYRWEVGGEEFTTSSPTLTYRWPVGGSYSVTCATLDGRGGYASHAFNVTVEDSLTTWTRRAQGLTTRPFYAATHARNQFVAVGSGAVATSPDGITWTLGDSITGFYVDVVSGDSGYVAVGSKFVSATQSSDVYLGRSTNGLNWQDSSPSGVAGGLNSVAFGAGRFVAVGRNGVILHSPDGGTWTRANADVTRTLHEVRFAAGQFMIVGEGGTILTSTDGLNWRNRSLAIPWQIVVAAYYRNGWLISGQGQRWNSTDGGETWVQSILPGRPLFHTIVPAAQSQLLLVSRVAFDDILVSEDGQRWGAAPVIVPQTENFQWGIAEANGTVVVVGREGRIYQSSIRNNLIVAPAIATAPRTQSVATGQTFTLHVTATGGGLLYQWHKNGTPIAGATGATLTIANAGAASAGAYSVTVTNFAGAVTSAAASITVDARTIHVAQMTSSRSATSGTDITLSVTAGGQAPFTYQWQKDGTDIWGATGGTLPLGLVVPSDSGNYTVRVADASGSVLSEPVVLAVAGEIPFQVSTVAGQLRTAGTSDGIGAGATFTGISDLVVDAAGYVYLSDRTAHTIRKISPSGQVTTLAGRAGTAGFADGAGANALFNLPTGVALDRGGNLFVADLNNNRLRKVAPNGVVTTFVGQFQGSTDGIGTVARFGLPVGLAIDSAGNLYCSESLNHTIRKITPAGLVTTLAGQARETGVADGTGANARFNSPAGLVLDEEGNIFVADSNNHTIRKITPGGGVTTLVGQAGVAGSTDGTGSAVRLSNPRRLARDAAGNLFVSMVTNVRRITPGGVVTTPIGAATGTYLDGLGSAARFGSLTGIAADHQGTLYLADNSNMLLRKAALVGRRAARLVNLSVRSAAGSGADTLIVGFSLAGGRKPLLIRAVGPTLAALGVGGTLADPTLRLEQGGTLIAQNDNWNSSGTDNALAALAAGVGAFALPAGSNDAALLEELPPNAYTAQVGGGSGVALVEVYDAGGTSLALGGAGPRVTNISARARAGTGADSLIVGFVIGGDTAKTVLIRGVGPTLSVFGLSGTLAAPQLQLYRDAMPVADNSGWGGGAALKAAFEQVGAFPLAAEAKDAALLVTLLPGAYTAHVVGPAGATGVALVEIYELP